ncbi:MAG: hypothetical protein JWM68_2862, partial [Verrucomicrobiales bacterium]|nr:hypothetical protein [Verrucomicrobiales bacterium]
YMAEGSVCYFHPQDSLWRNARLRPQLAKLSKETDWFAEAARNASRFNVRLISWTIGCHNSRLGLAHPELTQQNVYGDRLPHALCPVQPDVRHYLHILCRDLAINHPLWAIQMEAFGWLGLAHGHHHERDLVGLTPLEQELMGLCVCPACTDAAGTAGVDMDQLKSILKSTLDTAFHEAPTRPKGHPASMIELESHSPAIQQFNHWRRKFLVSLIASIKSESLAGTNCRLLLQSEFEPELAGVVDGFSCFAFTKTSAETQSICESARQAIPNDWKGLLQCCIQLGMGVPQSEQDLRDIIQAVANGGCNGIAFYNRSEAPPKMLQWLKTIGATRWPTPQLLLHSVKE